MAKTKAANFTDDRVGMTSVFVGQRHIQNGKICMCAGGNEMFGSRKIRV